MSKYHNFQIFILLATSLTTTTSCRDCPPCQKDVELPICIENSIPYQVGDTVMFRSSLDDTLILVCDGREYFQNVNPPEPNSEDCCHKFESEELLAKLNGENCSLTLSTQHVVKYYYMYIYLTMNGDKQVAEWYACDKGIFKFTSVTLSQRTFHNVIGFSLSHTTDSLYLNSEDQFGVVGFKVDGVEWAKID